MSKVESLERTVSELSADEMAEFRHWFIEFEVASWDRQIESDAASGRLDQLAERALSAHRRGESREL